MENKSKSNAKLNTLLAIEKEIQEKWDNEKIFEEEVPNKASEYYKQL